MKRGLPVIWKKPIVLMCLTICMSPLFSRERMLDVLYLKDGSVVRGTILGETRSGSVRIRDIDGNVSVHPGDAVIRIAEEPGHDIYSGVIRNKKSPWLAFGLSYLFPGLGQYYNGEVRKGILQEVLVIGGLVLAFSDAGWKWEYDYYYDEYNWAKTRVETGWYWIGVCAAAGGTLWSVIDAPVSANRINSEIRYGHLFEYPVNGNTLGFDIAPRSGGLGARLAFHF